MKVLLPIVLLVVAVGLWFAFVENGPAPAPPEHTSVDREPATAPTPPAPVATGDLAAPADDSGRRAVATGAPSHAEAEQGVRGRVVLPGGGPVAGVAVYLLPSMTDPLAIMLLRKKLQKVQPVAQAETGADGLFALGVTKVDAAYELRIVSADHPEVQRKGIKLRSQEWYDVKDMVLEPGGVLQGRVVDEAGKFGIASARVFLTVPGLDNQMLATPGRERGIAAVTDGAGYFRYTNAPRDGLVTLGAEADTYAYAEKANIQVSPDATGEQTIELAQGEPIAGIVVDPNGKPVSAAVVTATAQSAKLPQTATTTTGSDGRFQVPLLRPGPYQLVVAADNFEGATEKPVFTNDLDVKIVLEQRGKVRLRVLSSRGTPVRSYIVQLRRFFANNPGGGIGKVPEFNDVRVTASDYDGEYANIRNVPNGEFVFQLLEPNHAKTLSQPFTMTSGGQTPTVEVTLTMGASITGIVVDETGQPVPGASVSSDLNGGLGADLGWGDVFKSMMPDKHTAKATATDREGRFVLNQLAFADYMVRVTHPDFCDGAAVDIRLDAAGQTKDVGTIALVRGCIVEGSCAFAGRAMGQIKVTIGLPDGQRPDVDQNGKPRQRLFGAQVLSDSDGHYRFLRRVPPGTYKIYATRSPGSSASLGSPFDVLRDMRATQRPLVVSAGQDQQTANFDIPGQ